MQSHHPQPNPRPSGAHSFHLSSDLDFGFHSCQGKLFHLVGSCGAYLCHGIFSPSSGVEFAPNFLLRFFSPFLHSAFFPLVCSMPQMLKACSRQRLGRIFAAAPPSSQFLHNAAHISVCAKVEIYFIFYLGLGSYGLSWPYCMAYTKCEWRTAKCEMCSAAS